MQGENAAIQCLQGRSKQRDPSDSYKYWEDIDIRDIVNFGA